LASKTLAGYEHELLCDGMQQLGTVGGLRLIGNAADKASVMSFVLAGYTTEEVGQALNEEGIAAAQATTARNPSCGASGRNHGAALAGVLQHLRRNRPPGCRGAPPAVGTARVNRGAR